MVDKPFRVLLDVTDLNLENFKYVWINVSPRELKTIYDLKKCALHKVNLETEDVQLFIRDGLLLDEETVLVLREDDTVKFKYKKHHTSDHVKDSPNKSVNSSRKRNLSENNVNDENTDSKRHKLDFVPSISSQDENNFDKKKSKLGKKKNKTEPFLNFENNSSSLIEEVVVEGAASYHKKKSNKKKKKSITEDEATVDINNCGTNDSFFSFDDVHYSSPRPNESITTSKDVYDNENVVVITYDSSTREETSSLNLTESCKADSVVSNINNDEGLIKNKPKRKRKRHRKRNQTLTITEISGNSDDVNNGKSFLETVNKNVNRKHILYSVSTNKIQESDYLNDSSDFQNPSTDTFVKKNKSDIHSQNYPKISTPAQSSTCSIPDWQFSLMPSKNSNQLSCSENGFVLNDKPITKDVICQTTKSEEIKSEKELYDDLPELTSLPEVGFHVVYKVLELDENYSPKISDYREGIVEKIHPGTEKLEIRLKKEIILPGKTGKFENLLENEIPEPTVKKYDTLKWCDMISPKFMCLTEL